jgi:hypothetical protein
MKTITIAILTAAMTLSGCGVSSSMSDGNQNSPRQEKKAAEFEKIATLLESGNFQFTLRSATPTGGKTIQMTSEYTLEAIEGIYQAYLPYFGRAYSASYGGDGGIEFKGAPENLTLTRNEKKNIVAVSFEMKTDDDQYKVSLEIGSSGYGTLTVSSQKRQSISYYGQVGELRI